MIFPEWSISRQEYLAVKNGIKPVMRHGIERKSLHELKKYFEKEKMEVVVKNLDFKRTHSDIQTVLYISRSRDAAKKTCQAESENSYIEFGKLLGYPECCVLKFEIETASIADEKTSFVLNTFSQTKGKPSFYANNILNFQSRLNFTNKLSLYMENLDMFKKYYKYFLISHVPCSYKCKKSIEIGKKILKIIEKEDPRFAKRIVYNIKRIFLVIDDLNFVSFNGKVKGNSINYLEACPLLPLFKGLNFEKGNIVTVDDNKIRIFRDDKLLNEIKTDSKPRIIDFS